MILGGTKGGFPEQDIAVSYEQMITDGKFINISPWTVENPHPGFGKDPNILNEYGHSQYPMWVDNPDGSTNRIIVNSKEEYEALIKPKQSIPAAADWAAAPKLKQDGPTLAEYIAAGYKASDYPPIGYASKSTEEEIKTAIVMETADKANPWPTNK